MRAVPAPGVVAVATVTALHCDSGVENGRDAIGDCNVPTPHRGRQKKAASFRSGSAAKR
jgi:hypothetical protein